MKAAIVARRGFSTPWPVRRLRPRAPRAALAGRRRLSVASETGLPSLALFLTFWALVLVRSSPRASPLRAGLRAGLVALLVHGLVDGNLTVIPSTAFLAYVAAGVLHARDASPAARLGARQRTPRTTAFASQRSTGPGATPRSRICSSRLAEATGALRLIERASVVPAAAKREPTMRARCDPPAHAALERIGMRGFARRYPRELSGGQQQRVALGRSIVLEPSVLLMDEPLSNLDAKLRISIRMEITNLQRVTGVTTIYVTHDQEEALAMSDTIAVMNAGRVDQYGSPEDVFYRPSSHFVADFIGLASFIPAKVTRMIGGSCELAFGRERRIETRVADPASLRVGAAVTAMLRPEGIEVHPASIEGHASAIVQDSAMLGSGVRYWVELDGHVLTVNQVKEPGDTILSGEATLRFKPNWVHVMPAGEG